MELWLTIRANIIRKKGAFLSVFLLSLLISVCLTAIISVNKNLESRAKDALEEIKAGDVISLIRDRNYTPEMQALLEKNKHVDKITELDSLTQALVINKIQKNSSTFFLKYDPANYPYKIYDTTGLAFEKNPAKLQKGEIYVPISFRDMYKCKVGDTAYWGEGDRKNSYTIKGFYEEPFAGCSMVGLKLALLNEEDFDRVFALRNQEEKTTEENAVFCYKVLNIFQKKDSSISQTVFKKSINIDSKVINYALFSITKERSISYTMKFVQIMGGIMLVFLFLLYIVVLIVIGHNISTGIEMDYVNIGVLKALGYSKGKLRMIYSAEYLLAELLGIFLGTLLGIPALHYLSGAFITVTTLLGSGSLAILPCLSIIALILLCSVVFIVCNTRKITKVSPIVAISGGKESVSFRSVFELPIEQSALNLRIAFRSITSNIRQYIGSTIIVALLAFFLISVTSLNQITADRKLLMDNFGQIRSDVVVRFPNEKDAEGPVVSREEVEAIIQKESRITQTSQFFNLYYTINGEEYLGLAYDKPELIKSVIKGRTIRYSNEILITDIISDELGIGIGDKVEISFKDASATYLVCGIYQCTFDVGRVFAYSFDGAKKLIPDIECSEYSYLLADGSKSKEITETLTKKFDTQIEVTDANRADDSEVMIMNSIGLLNAVIYILSILFIIIIVIIICQKLFRKEQIDIGIYKALGFSSRSLRLQFSLRFLVISIIGGIIGALANLVFNNMMMSTLLRSIGITSFQTTYTVPIFLIPILFVSLSFFLLSYLAARRAKKVSPRNLITE